MAVWWFLAQKCNLTPDLRWKSRLTGYPNGTNGVVSVNYYERYCGDYQRDTAHLSLAEHGAYTMLLDTYFSVEKPLPEELPSLYRVCRAMTRQEQLAVKAVAEQFFPVSQIDGLRHNQRADREIAKARPKIDAARINGRKGGRPTKEMAGMRMGQEIPPKPGGLFSGSETATPPVTPAEPGSKAHQHQHQHQHQLHNIETCNTQTWQERLQLCAGCLVDCAQGVRPGRDRGCF